MKTLYLIPVVLLAGCAQLMKGQQPDPPKMIEKGTYSTECSGLANNFGVCFEAASKVCPAGYEVLEQVQGTNAPLRKVIFKCK